MSGKFPKATSARPLFEHLEPRLLLDAGVIAELLETTPVLTEEASLVCGSGGSIELQAATQSARAELFTVPNTVRYMFSTRDGWGDLASVFQYGESMRLRLELTTLGYSSFPDIADDVTFVITDSSNDVVWTRSLGHPWGAGKGSGGGGSATSIGWGQVDGLNNPVSPGNYSAGVILVNPTYPQFPSDFSGAVPFTIVDVRQPAPPGWSQDIRLTYNYSYNGGYYPSVAADSTSSVHIAWSDRRDYEYGQASELYYQKLDPDGHKLVYDTRLTNVAVLSEPTSPRSVAVDSMNNVHVVWKQGDDDIFYTKLDGSGNTVVDDTQILTRSGPALYYPSIAVDSTDRVHVSIREFTQGTSYVVLDSNGQVLRTTRSIGYDHSGYWTGEPGIAIDSSDNVYMTWFDSYDYQIHLIKLDADGHTIIPNKSVSQGLRRSEVTPKIAVDTADNVHVVWQNQDSDGFWQIFYTKLDSQGNTLVEAKMVSQRSDARMPHKELCMAVGDQGNVHVVWPDGRDGIHETGYGYEIYYLELNNDGVPVVPDTRLTSYGGGSVNPSIAVRPDGKVVVVWQDIRHGFVEIYAKLREADHTIIVDAGDDQTAYEGSQVSFAGVFVDLGATDTYSYLWDFGDGATATDLTTTHAYADNDVYVATLTVTAGDAHVGVGSLTVTVSNVAPTVTDLQADPMVDENGVLNLTGAFTDPGTLDTHTVMVNWGDGASETMALAVGDRSFTATHQYLDDDPSGTPQDPYAIQVTLADDDGGQDAASATTTIYNVAPVITAFSSSASQVGDAAEGQEVTVAGQFTDVGTLDTHTAVVDWGDGTSSPGVVTESNGSGSVSAAHTYAEGGIYTITLDLEDDDTGAAVAATTALITGAGVMDGVLEIVGTAGDDVVAVNLFGDRSDPQFKVHASFLPARDDDADGGFKAFDALGISKIVILLGDGNDYATIAGNIATPAVISGGAGDDHLHGGRGDDILDGGSGDDVIEGGPGGGAMNGDAYEANFVVGVPGDANLDGVVDIEDFFILKANFSQDPGAWGDGNFNEGTLVDISDFFILKANFGKGSSSAAGDGGADILLGGLGADELHGGKGRDLLVGGAGPDEIIGGADDDLLIGGSTSYDDDFDLLAGILAQWNSGTDYESRVAHIRGAFLQAGATVFDDGRTDNVTGGSGRDWFFADLDGLDGDDDILPGLNADEVVDLL